MFNWVSCPVYSTPGDAWLMLGGPVVADDDVAVVVCEKKTIQK